jgi:predicted DNA-binding transcriptional regulator AlpA
MLADGHAPRGPPAFSLVVYSLSEAARITGLARRTLERLIQVGQRPPIIELSPRRRGILASDLRDWLQRRRRSPPGEPSDRSPLNP